MNHNKQYIRSPNGNSEQKLAKRLGLHWDKTDQDWELIASDYKRVKEFLNLYQNELDNDEDKFTLMGLIISSFDDSTSYSEKQVPEYWDICKTILEKECFLHYSIIEYWSLLENEPDNLFAIWAIAFLCSSR